MEQLESWEQPQEIVEDWEKPKTTSPMSGGVFDYIFNKTPIGRVASKFTQGGLEGVESGLAAIHPQTEEYLKQIPDLWDVYRNGDEQTSKAFRDAYTRPGVWNALITRALSVPVAAATGAAYGALGAIGEAGMQAAKEVGDTGEMFINKTPLGKYDPLNYIAKWLGQELGPATFSGQYFPEVGMKPIDTKSKPKVSEFEGEALEPISDTLPKSLPSERPSVRSLPSESYRGTIAEDAPRFLVDDTSAHDVLTQPLDDAFSTEMSPKPEDSNYWPDFPGLATARANGVIGNGDIGFFNTFPLTEAEIKSRTDAALEAGMPEPPVPEPPVTDVPTLARFIHPELMERWDDTTNKLEQARQRKDDMLEQYRSYPDYDFVESEVAKLSERVTSGKITSKEQDRLTDLQQFMKVHKSAEKAQKEINDLDLDLRDMATDVTGIHDYARTLLPDISAQAHEDWYQTASKYSEDLLSKQNELEAQYRGQISEPLSDTVVPEEDVQAASETVGRASRPARKPVQPVPGVSGTTSSRKSTGPLKLVDGSGAIKTRGLSKSVEARAIEADLIDHFEGLPEYETVSKAEQAKAAVELINTDYERALAVAMGDKQPPKGLLLTSVFKAVEAKARREGDVDTILDLASRSKAPGLVTTMAQNLAMLADADPHSPVNAIRALQEAKETAANKHKKFQDAIKNVVKEIKRSMKARVPTKIEWKGFFDDIMCAGDE